MQQFFQSLIQPHGIPDHLRGLLVLCHRLVRFIFFRIIRLYGCTVISILYLLRSFFLIFFRLLRCICGQIRHFFRLRRHFLIPVIVFFLLGRSQRFVLHLQLHSLIYILSFAEPEDKVVALFQAFCRHARFLIQFCQFIRPLFDVLCFFKFFQCFYLLFDRCSLCAKYLIPEDVLIWILRRNLHKIIVIVYRFIYISRLNSQCTKMIDYLTASFRTVISES